MPCSGLAGRGSFADGITLALLLAFLLRLLVDIIKLDVWEPYLYKRLISATVDSRNALDGRTVGLLILLMDEKDEVPATATFRPIQQSSV